MFQNNPMCRAELKTDNKVYFRTYSKPSKIYRFFSILEQYRENYNLIAIFTKHKQTVNNHRLGKISSKISIPVQTTLGNLCQINE